MPINIAQALNDLNTETSIAFQKGLETAPKIYNQYTKTIKSSKSLNTYGFLGAFPEMKETPRGADVAKANMAKLAYSLDNVQHDVIVPVDMNQVKDGEVDGTELGMAGVRSQTTFLNKNAAQLLVKGYERLCYDGQPMFDHEHPITANPNGTGAVSAVSNIIGARTATGKQWIVMDDAGFIAPFFIQEREAPSFLAVTSADSADVLNKNTYDYKSSWRGAFGYGFWQTATSSKDVLNEDNLTLAMQAIQTAKVNGGDLLYANPTILLVPASLAIVARKLVTAPFNTSGATNVFAGSMKVIVVPELD